MKVTHNAPPGPQSIEKTPATAKAAAASKAKVEELAKPLPDVSSSAVEISEKARLMQKAADVAHGSPDVRKDKVAALKKNIQNGTYQVNSGAVAEKLIEEHLQTDFGKNKV
jgi:negative regulator of flagellin synthesis FlgM